MSCFNFFKRKAITEEKPPHELVSGHEEEFILARETELEILKSKVLGLGEKVDILYNWMSFCEPYGFEFLGHFAQDLLVSLEKNEGNESILLIKKIENYLKSRKNRLFERQLSMSSS